MKGDDVVRFIESIKEPEILLKYCEKFHKIDPRDADYVVSRSIIVRDPNNINFVLAGARIMIITWNAPGFQRLPVILRLIWRGILLMRMRTLGKN